MFSDKENINENINPHSTKIMLKRNAKILRSQCSNSNTYKCKNTKEFHPLNIANTAIQDNNISNYKEEVSNEIGTYYVILNIDLIKMNVDFFEYILR